MIKKNQIVNLYFGGT